MEKNETKEKLKEIEAYDTGMPLMTEISFNFYNTMDLIEEGKEKGAISDKDYEDIKKEFEKLEDKLEKKGIISEE